MPIRINPRSTPLDSLSGILDLSRERLIISATEMHGDTATNVASALWYESNNGYRGSWSETLEFSQVETSTTPKSLVIKLILRQIPLTVFRLSGSGSCIAPAFLYIFASHG